MSTISETLRLFVALGDPSVNRPDVPFDEQLRCEEEVLALADRLDTKGEPRVGDLVAFERYSEEQQGVIFDTRDSEADEPEKWVRIGCEWSNAIHVVRKDSIRIIARSGYKVEEHGQ